MVKDSKWRKIWHHQRTFHDQMETVFNSSSCPQFLKRSIQNLFLFLEVSFCFHILVFKLKSSILPKFCFQKTFLYQIISSFLFLIRSHTFLVPLQKKLFQYLFKWAFFSKFLIGTRKKNYHKTWEELQIRTEFWWKWWR